MINKIKEYLAEHGFIRNPEAEALGVSRAMLSFMAKSGELQRVAQGVYALTDAIPDELLVISNRSPNIVFSHETALALHKLHNRIPDKPTITIPQDYRISRSVEKIVKTYRIKRVNHELGRTTVATFMGNQVPCYDPERTICDIIRSYSRMDIETYSNALRTYAKCPSRNVPRLMEYAKVLGIEEKVVKIMELLIA